MIFDIYTYTGQEQSIRINPGSYLFQLWGANGGNNQSNCGYGGSSGIIQIHEFATLYLFVGGKGVFSKNPTGGFIGGGNGHIGGNGLEAGGGGGATDIRFNSKSLESRIIVAGGGGGGRSGNPPPTGGAGGGLVGLNGNEWNSTVNGWGGTQTNGGRGGTYGSFKATDGRLLYGGNATGASFSGGGGGGGYYGGGGSYETGGGGGSGYISHKFIKHFFLNGDEYAQHLNPKVEELRQGNGLITITKLQKEATKPISQRIHLPSLTFFFIILK